MAPCRGSTEHLGLQEADIVTDTLSKAFGSMGGYLATSQALARLVKANIFVAPAIFPACPKNGPRLRFTVTSGHTVADMDEIIETFGSGL